jgi:cytochrome c biogenesis protein CcmG, thiol:disulfide interchange protein DsbE
MARPLKLTVQALVLAAVAGLFALLVWRIVHQNAQAKVGKRAPAFTAKRLEGRGTLSLASFRGHPVVLNFWASWCAPCKREAPALERTYARYRDRGLVVLGVDYTDASSDARAFAAKRGLTFPIVRDGGGLIGSRYGLTGVPETFVIDRRGRIVDHLLAPVEDGQNRDAFARALQEALKT